MKNKFQYQNKVLLISVLLMAFTSFAFSQNRLDKLLQHLSTADNYVMVASHRGDWRNAPENSVQAIKNCIGMGVDIVEIDVRLTKDSVPVLMHDATIDRTSTGAGKVADWTLDSLRTLNLLSSCNIATRHKIPTLEEAMLAAKGQILINLDKCSDYMDKVYPVLLKTGTVNQAILKGTKNIDDVRHQYGFLLDKIIFMPILDEKTPGLLGFVDDYLTEYKATAFEVLFTDDNSQMFEVIKSIKKRNSRVWVNTLWESLCGLHDDDLAVDDPDAAWGWVVERGANIIQTDRPAMLVNYLNNKCLHE